MSRAGELAAALALDCAGGPAVGGNRDRGLTAQVLSRQRPGRGLDLLRCARGRDPASELARAWSEIDQVVGRLDDLAVVLDQDQGIAQVSQAAKSTQQPGIVARVQADRGLVKHIEHAGQPAADLAGQADALALAAGERGRSPRQRQVIEPDLHQEGQPVADLAHQVAGDVPLVGRELELVEEGHGLTERPAADLVERVAMEPHGRRVVAQPGAHAGGAGDVVHHPL